MKHAFVLLLVLPACIFTKGSAAPAPAPTPAAATAPAAGATAPLAGTMAEAPTQAFPSTITAELGCNQAGYMILGVPEGQAFSIQASVTEGCAMVAVMKANGSTNDLPSKEVCADAPQTIESVGQAEKTFVTVHETGACVGNSATLAFQ
jgi:hypothetical protein